MREYTYAWNPIDYDDESQPILKITKSSFGSFQWCPQKYFFQYPLRMPIDQSPAMAKGSIVHNSQEDFFNTFDIKKAESMSPSEVKSYCMSLFPVDDHVDMYDTMATTATQRFLEARDEGRLNEYLPPGNEVMLDAEIVIQPDWNPKAELSRPYRVHIQGIIDRIFQEDGFYIPMELKTGPWKDYKRTMMRKEMAFYKLLFDNSSPDVLRENGLNPEYDMKYWGWYYPASNYTYVEECKASSHTAVLKGLVELVAAYEKDDFYAKYFFKTCSNCSFYGICEKAQEESWM